MFSIYVQYADYKAFDKTIAQLTTNNHLSLYNVPATCFGLSMAIVREVSKKGIQ
jgi:hypothetical protein